MKTRSKVLFLVSAGVFANVIWASIPPFFEKPADDSAEFSVTAQPIANAAKYARVVTGEGWPHSPKDEESVLVKLDGGTQLAYRSTGVQKKLEEHQKAVQEQRYERNQDRYQKMQEEKAREEKEKMEAENDTTAMLGAASAGAFDNSVQLASLDTNTQTDVPMAQPGAERLAKSNDNFMQVTTDPIDAPVETVVAPVDVATHFVVTPGVSYYRLQLPDYSLPVSIGVTTAPYPGDNSTEYNLNEYGVMPTLNFDYSFENTHILKGLFGDRLHILTDFAYMHGSRQTTKDLGGTQGFVWDLNGGGTPVNYENHVFLDNQRTKLTYDLIDFTTAMSGEKNINSFLQFNPRIGVAFTYFKQQYNYDIDGTQQTTSVPFDVTGYSKVKSTYFGPMVGGRLLLKAGQHVGSFVDLELQALHAHTSFNGNQDALSVLNKNSNSQNSDNLFTYRAKLGLGVDYYWTGIDAPKSVKFSLNGGLDFWGYMPEVVNPDEANSKDAHTERTTALNNYINVSVAIPLM